jgi:hypothetical protein
MFHEVLSKFIHKNFKVLKGWTFYVFLNKDQFFCKMEKKRVKWSWIRVNSLSKYGSFST